MARNTICLWYEGTALEAANFYARIFPNSAVGSVQRAPGDYPDGKQGDVLNAGGAKTKWGISWQITPRVLMDALGNPDRAAAKRAFEAMMGMKKIDVAAIESARRG